MMMMESGSVNYPLILIPMMEVRNVARRQLDATPTLQSFDYTIWGKSHIWAVDHAGTHFPWRVYMAMRDYMHLHV